MKKTTRIWLVIIMLSGNYVQAQYVMDYKRTADNYFQTRDYYSAAQYYNRALGTSKGKPDEVRPYLVEKTTSKKGKQFKDHELIVYRLAESYRMYYDYGNAEKWYEQVVAFNGASASFPLARFWYGVSLRANNKYDEALSQFRQFKQEYKGLDEYTNKVDLEIASCEFASNEMKKTSRYEVAKMTGNINQGGANYATAQPNSSTLYFTTSRPEQGEPDKKNTPYVNNIYEATANDDKSYSNEKKLQLPVAKGLDQGTPALSPDGNTLYITRWSVKNGVKQSSIYSSIKQGDAWAEPKPLDAAVNVEGYSAKEPFITPDGKYLVFASNRPGGMGKFDLWYSSITDGRVGAAQNMGTTINTKEEEQAPYYDNKANLLVFSSNGRIGFGGLDFFQSKGNFGAWSVPENMGHPINSQKDDLYYASVDNDMGMRKGYISSDRESVCCLEIYTVTRKSKMLGGLVLDCDTKQALTGAKITLLDTVNNKVIDQVVINESGMYMFEVEMKKRYKVVAEKDNYFTKAIQVSTSPLANVDTMMSPSFCLNRYEIGKAIILRDIFYDYNKADLREQSLVVLDTLYSIMVDNPAITIELSAHTDSKGTDAYNLKLSEARAQACVNYLISKGIARARLESKGYGESKPIAPNTQPNGKDNPDGRQLNRRTEFKVLRN
ncbi:OmpA family protein [uncultured Chitinophaga sp.]|uniref:OmpA family protein n=1 Tax=uncultured Chitinophaga sp. TaxID=339340 RepID=UPI0025F03D91|nr:OmpA family protein [uncultured Chitinophaga sp.]